MKDGKPEVVAWLCEYEGIAGDHSFAAHTSEKTVRKVPPDFGEPEPLIRLSDHEAVVAEIRSELERTKAREADTDKQLLALRRAIAKTPTDTGDEKHQDALAEWEIILERIAERYEFRDAPQR